LWLSAGGLGEFKPFFSYAFLPRRFLFMPWRIPSEHKALPPASRHPRRGGSSQGDAVSAISLGIRRERSVGEGCQGRAAWPTPRSSGRCSRDLGRHLPRAVVMDKVVSSAARCSPGWPNRQSPPVNGLAGKAASDRSSQSRSSGRESARPVGASGQRLGPGLCHRHPEPRLEITRTPDRQCAHPRPRS
jgi:hypothetical protein